MGSGRGGQGKANWNTVPRMERAAAGNRERAAQKGILNPTRRGRYLSLPTVRARTEPVAHERIRSGNAA
jgi:hypothetical protein